MATLHQTRLRSLPRLHGRWRLLPERRPSPWLSALRECYDLLTLQVFGDVRHRTFAVTAPLSAGGGYGMLGFIESGTTADLRVSPPASGDCAERKILQNQLLELHAGLTGTPEVWLFYTTRSPCVHCGKAIVDGLRQGAYKHLVVAFEGCYQPHDPLRSIPSRAFFERVRRRYDPNDPGIELFKVYRAPQHAVLFATDDAPTVSARRVVRDLLPERRSRRRKDIGAADEPLAREMRSAGAVRAGIGDLPVISEVKDLLAANDPTLQFLRATRA